MDPWFLGVSDCSSLALETYADTETTRTRVVRTTTTHKILTLITMPRRCGVAITPQHMLLQRLADLEMRTSC